MKQKNAKTELADNNAVQNYTEEDREKIVEDANNTFYKMLSGGSYKDILIKFGQNGNLSLTNTLYVLSQNPNATVVKNMGEWNRLGRSIIPGSTGIEIMAPTKETESREVKENGEVKLDGSGQPVTRDYTKTIGFHPAYVFDIAATTGAEYKPYAIGDNVTKDEKQAILDGIFSALGKRRYKYKFADNDKLPEGHNCKIDTENKTVFIRKGLDSRETVLTLLDASARALAGHSKTRVDFEGLIDESAANMEAASIDCILAAHYGLGTDGYDFSEMDNWSDEQKIAFRDNVGVMCSATKLLMDKVDYSFYKSRQATANASAVVAPRAPFQGSKVTSSEATLG